MVDRAAVEKDLVSASRGFDRLFTNDLDGALKHLSTEGDSPFHAMGLGLATFLQAALAMEPELIAEAAKSLAKAEAGAKKEEKAAKYSSSKGTYFATGAEWQVLQADAILLQSLCSALSETYGGYMKCLYSLNNAHSRFTALFKQVFPAGLDGYMTPGSSRAPSPKPSVASLASTAKPSSPGLLGRWTGGFLSAAAPTPTVPAIVYSNEPLDALVIAGTAFGFGLFNLVFSLLPPRIRSVVSFLGFQHDRPLALRALAVAATKQDVHSVFAALTLVTYDGVILSLAGWLADEQHVIKQMRNTVNPLLERYPDGSLWILNQAKILRLTGDPAAAIELLQAGLSPEKKSSFVQADTVLLFELAWTLWGQRRYTEAGEAFLRMMTLNKWSPATYTVQAAGCFLSAGETKRAKELLKGIPGMLANAKGFGGRELPSEIDIKKKIELYKKKQVLRGKNEADWVDVIKISPTDENAIMAGWFSRIPEIQAQANIDQWLSLTPRLKSSLPAVEWEDAGSDADLLLPQERAMRSLLLGMSYASCAQRGLAHSFLLDVSKQCEKGQAWVDGVARFERAVLQLHVADVQGTEADWPAVIKDAERHLNDATSLINDSDDLGSRLGPRIAILRDELRSKKASLSAAGVEVS